MSHLPAFSHYHLPRMSEMRRVYWTHSVGLLGASLVSIFIPIYLLKIGYTFSEVLLFLLLQNVFSVILQYPVGILFRFIRPHHLLAIGSLGFAALFALLNTQSQYNWPLSLLALAWAINRSVYWPAFHYCFSLARAHHQSGRQIAGLHALVIFFATAAPAIGGIIATVFGMSYVYAAAIALTLAAIAPMLQPKYSPQRVQIKITRDLLRHMRPDVVANGFNGMVIMAELNLWPLLVFFLVSSYAGVGILSSIIAFASILVTLYVGRNEARKGPRHFLRRGVATYSLTSIGRALVQNTGQVFGLNLLSGIGRSLYVTPYMDRYYHNSDGSLRLGYIITMELAFVLGSTLFVLGLIGLNFFFSPETTLSIGLAYVALAVLGARLIR